MNYDLPMEHFSTKHNDDDVELALFAEESGVLEAEVNLDALHAELTSFDNELDLLSCYQKVLDLDLIEQLDYTVEANATEITEKIKKSKASTIDTNTNRTTTKQTSKKKRRKPATCNLCQRIFTDPYNLRIHMMTHTGEKPYECDTCGKRFRQQTKLKIHYVTHTNERPHVCIICEKGFRYANYLTVHRRLHTGEKPYKCAHCSQQFHSLHTRRMHTKLQHALPAAQSQSAVIYTTYTCPLCEKVLTDQCYLTAHLKRHHYNQRDYACDQCEKRFHSDAELKNHQITHTQLRAFPCDVCGARFLRKSNYKQHLKIHTRRTLS